MPSKGGDGGQSKAAVVVGVGALALAAGAVAYAVKRRQELEKNGRYEMAHVGRRGSRKGMTLCPDAMQPLHKSRRRTYAPGFRMRDDAEIHAPSSCLTLASLSCTRVTRTVSVRRVYDTADHLLADSYVSLFHPNLSCMANANDLYRGASYEYPTCWFQLSWRRLR